MQKNLIIFTSLFLSCITNLTFGNNKNTQNNTPYQIEVIVFSKITPDAYNSETWPQINPYTFNETTQNNLQRLEELNSINYQRTPPAFNQLQQIEKKLRKNHYTILYHRSWWQTAPLTQKQAIPITIQGGRTFSQDGKPINKNYTKIHKDSLKE